MAFDTGFYLSRHCVRERNKGGSPPSFAAPRTAVGLGSSRKQILLVPYAGKEVKFSDLFLFLV